MLNFEEFKEYVADHIKDYLGEEYENASVDIQQVNKNNGTVLNGIVVRREDERVAPTLYLHGYFEHYQKGRELDFIIGDVADRITKHRGQGFENLAMQFTKFENMKDKIVMSIVNAQKNEEFLKNTPHTIKEDLAVIYKVLVGSDEEFINMMRDDISASAQMYVISNSAAVNGAASIVYSNALDDLAKKLNSDLFVLPSSVHEVLAVSTEVGDAESFADMVRSVNEEQVAYEEQLSDHVYRYDAKNHTLTLADVSVAEIMKETTKEQEPDACEEQINNRRKSR